MFKLIELIQALLPRFETQAERDQTSLNEAVDIHDLERRMREIDGRASTLATGLRLGLVLRCGPASLRLWRSDSTRAKQLRHWSAFSNWLVAPFDGFRMAHACTVRAGPAPRSTLAFREGDTT